ncbi:MAG: hypothetical protein NZ455_16475 [Bacteroidia bacterium]|nr:hypothetical protein [Bacteroidia bacterium]MDW8347093.1 hypothetical protein [Bacteroidia bacterium]
MGVPLAVLRVGVLRAALRFGATLRYALLTHPPHASRKLLLDALPCIYTCVCFTLFDTDY